MLSVPWINTGLTGRPVLALAVAGAVLPVVAVAWLARRRTNGVPPGRSMSGWRARSVLTRVVPMVVLVLCAQLFAMTALALRVNDVYLFYTSWADLFGRVSQGSAIQTGGLVGQGQGAVRLMTVPSRDTGSQHQVLVWLPPEYSLPRYRDHHFPVVLFLTGQPSTPQTAFRHFSFARKAMEAISSQHVPPFVAVFPTLMISPPRDTECTDVPGGPKAETWLAKDVPRFVTEHLRVSRPGKAWTTMGWSTGGFCSAKLVTSHPSEFGSAVAFGGYFQPVEDKTTGSLFGGRKHLALHNSPAWLYVHRGGLRGSRMLLIAGQQDKQTWRATSQMIRIASGDPSVAHIAFPQGGHNYRNYASYLPDALAWAAQGWPTGSHR
jgi:enterochelin esterase-like enzyme